jgi:MFS family permease
MTAAARRLPEERGKWRNVSLLALAALLGMSVWFSASAVVPQLTVEWKLSGALQSWLTTSVQLGFVAGALLSSLLTLSDRLPAQRLLAVSALAAAAFNAAIPLFNLGPGPALVCRFLTGFALAGVYPPGMKLVASWCKEDRGLGIGLLVGAITLGTAVPHLLNASPSGMPPWRGVLLLTSGQAVVAALIGSLFVNPGPYLGKSPPFRLARRRPGAGGSAGADGGRKTVRTSAQRFSSHLRTGGRWRGTYKVCKSSKVLHHAPRGFRTAPCPSTRSRPFRLSRPRKERRTSAS